MDWQHTLPNGLLPRLRGLRRYCLVWRRPNEWVNGGSGPANFCERSICLMQGLVQ